MFHFNSAVNQYNRHVCPEARCQLQLPVDIDHIDRTEPFCHRALHDSLCLFAEAAGFPAHDFNVWQAQWVSDYFLGG
jgi:hypothetical protein